jgi:hypothetical protein
MWNQSPIKNNLICASEVYGSEVCPPNFELKAGRAWDKEMSRVARFSQSGPLWSPVPAHKRLLILQHVLAAKLLMVKVNPP